MTAPTLTPGEAANWLGLDLQTIRRWIRCEQCPTVRVGRAVRIPAAWVDAELAATDGGVK